MTELNESKQSLAMVSMAFCKWTFMTSHHKLYELVHGDQIHPEIPPCNYDRLEQQSHILLKGLAPYGTLGPNGHWKMKRT